MPVEIDELVTRVSMTEGEGGLSARDWEEIKRMVMKLMDEVQRHQRIVRGEQRVTGGVSQELEEDLED